MIGRVYKITNADESIVYIGSTTKTVKQRFQKHKEAFARWLRGVDNATFCAIYEHFAEHGITTFSIQLVSEH
jgi:predicted GIY-YIG superfamily endonuclease